MKIEHPKYKAWIKRRPCQAPSEFAGGGKCWGLMDPHHVFGKGMGGSKQDDGVLVSLCRGHHIDPGGRLGVMDATETRAFLVEKALKNLLEFLRENNGRLA